MANNISLAKFKFKNMFSYRINNKERIFTYNGYDILASGILLHTVIDYKDYFLLRKDNSKRNQNNWSDLGGKVNKDDTTIFDTISREIIEETDSLIYNILDIDKKNERLKEWLFNSNPILIYNQNSKYLLLKIRINNLKKEDLIDIEAEDTIVKWKFINKYTKIRLHPRIKRHYFNNYKL